VRRRHGEQEQGCRGARRGSQARHQFPAGAGAGSGAACGAGAGVGAEKSTVGGLAMAASFSTVKFGFTL